MQRFNKLTPLAVSLGFFAVVLSLYPSYPAAAQTAPSIPVKAANTTKATAAAANNTISVPVTVVNTPLPVTGNVNASVNGTVNANITNASVPVSGTVNANITNTPSVNVSSLPAVQLAAGTTVGVTGGLANTSATPIFTRDVNSPSSEPFVASLCVGTGPGTCPTGSRFDYGVPATVGLNSTPVLLAVIEYYSASCVGVTPPSNSWFLDLNVRTAGSSNRHYVGLVLSSGSIYYSNQLTRLYADASSDIVAEFPWFEGGVATGSCNVTLSGYLVTQ
jgi:hypothetical protein